MKNSHFFLLLFFFILSCQGNNSNQNSPNYKDSLPHIDTVKEEINPIFKIHQDIDTFLLGDMNVDGIGDTAIVYSPFHAYPSPDDLSSGGCLDDSCLTEVSFSFTASKLNHTRALGFQILFATEDVNGDGIKEIGFIPNWFQSCWQGLFVYSLMNGEWKLMGSGSVYACLDEDFSKRVNKTNHNKFKIISMDWNEDGSEMIDTALFFNF